MSVCWLEVNVDQNFQKQTNKVSSQYLFVDDIKHSIFIFFEEFIPKPKLELINSFFKIRFFLPREKVGNFKQTFFFFWKQIEVKKTKITSNLCCRSDQLTHGKIDELKHLVNIAYFIYTLTFCIPKIWSGNRSSIENKLFEVDAYTITKTACCSLGQTSSPISLYI